LPFHPASGLPSAAALLQLLAFGLKLMLPLALLNLLVAGGIVLATT
jgi:NADH:ubiquinone oxidoreductase subunit H